MSDELVTTFPKVLVDTKDINQTISSFAKEKKVPLENIDFEIKQVYTIVESILTGDSVTYKTLDGDRVPLSIYTSGEVLLRQYFQIIIKPYEENPKAKIAIALSADKNYIKISATLKKGTTFRKHDGLAKIIYDEINKKIARSKLIIHLFEEDLKEQIAALLDKAPELVTLRNDVKLIGAHCKYYAPSYDDKIHFLFLEKQELVSSGTTEDMYNRGFTMATSAGDILIEYSKPKQGSSCINCQGHFLEAPVPSNLNEPKFSITQSIVRQEDAEKIYFAAGRSGNIYFDGQKLDILGNVEVQEINFRKTGSIVISEDKDVALNVMEADPVIDAIGPNMTVQSNEVNVRGSVGNDAKIIANICTIDGTTHSTTHIVAKTAKIHSLKGILEAGHADVERIEGGNVHAETINIGTISNSFVLAKRIKIKSLGSQNTLTASELIEIDEISGTDNKLIFETAATKSDKEEAEKLSEKIEELTKLYETVLEQFKRSSRQIEDNKETALKIKLLIDDDKKKGRAPLESFVSKYNMFINYVNNAKEIKSKLIEVKNELTALHSSLNHIYEKIINAKVKNNTVWKNFQTIIFRLGDNKEYKYNPQKDTKQEIIGIQKIGEDEYVIGAV
jgi:hypothetical protein